MIKLTVSKPHTLSAAGRRWLRRTAKIISSYFEGDTLTEQDKKLIETCKNLTVSQLKLLIHNSYGMYGDTRLKAPLMDEVYKVYQKKLKDEADVSEK